MKNHSMFSVLLFAASGIFCVAFALLLWRDAVVSYPFGSAPFYVYVLGRAIGFLIPAALCLLAALWLKKKKKR